MKQSKRLFGQDDISQEELQKLATDDIKALMEDSDIKCFLNSGENKATGFKTEAL